MKRSIAPAETDDKPPPKQARLSEAGEVLRVFTFPTLTGVSQIIQDRSSSFQAFFIPFDHGRSVPAFLKSFKSSATCDGVDHVMTAFRFDDSETGIDAGFDDDGERFAGKKLADLLGKMDVLGFLICIRKYGGILLGPIRFQHIVQCSREAIMVHRHDRSVADQGIQKLRRLLVARDRTITSLREILSTQLQEDASSSVGAPPRASQNSQTAGSQELVERYQMQPVKTLERLLVAKDMSIKSLRASLASRAD